LESFIVAKQQPNEESKFGYYIVPLQNKVHKSPDENKIGPLTIDEFKLKKRHLECQMNFPIRLCCF